MHDLEAIQRKFECLKASSSDPRICQVRGQAALDFSRAKDYTLDVDIQAWRARTGELHYDNHYDVKPDSADMSLLLKDGFVEGEFFLNLGADEPTEDRLVLELFDATEPEADGYKSVLEIIGFVRVEPLMVGSLLSWDVVGGALVRLTKQGTLEVLDENFDPINLDNACQIEQTASKPVLTSSRVCTTVPPNWTIAFRQSIALKSSNFRHSRRMQKVEGTIVYLGRTISSLLPPTSLLKVP